jgi:hypothetical protein
MELAKVNKCSGLSASTEKYRSEKTHFKNIRPFGRRRKILAVDIFNQHHFELNGGNFGQLATPAFDGDPEAGLHEGGHRVAETRVAKEGSEDVAGVHAVLRLSLRTRGQPQQLIHRVCIIEN